MRQGRKEATRGCMREWVTTAGIWSLREPTWILPERGGGHLFLEGCFCGRNSLTLPPGPCSGIFPQPGRKPQAAQLHVFSVICLPACRGECPETGGTSSGGFRWTTRKVIANRLGWLQVPGDP